MHKEEKLEVSNGILLDATLPQEELYPKLKEDKSTQNVLEQVKNVSLENIKKQDLILSEQKLQYQYGHYDEVRKKTMGFISSLELGVITSNNLSTIIENNIIKASDYWLTFAGGAYAYWYMDDVDKANKSIQKAISLNNSKASLFLAYTCAKEKRHEASFLWIKRYLNSIDVRNIDKDVITLIDAICSGVFGPKAINLCLEKHESWLKLLYDSDEIKTQTKALWHQFFKDNLESNEAEAFPYLQEYAKNFDVVPKMISIAKTSEKIFNKLNNTLDKSNNIFSPEQVISRLINTLETEESTLINSDNESHNLLYLLSQYVLLGEDVSSNQTKEFILKILEDIIIDSYQEFKTNYLSEEIVAIDIMIDNWIESSKDGYNEKQMHESLDKYFDKLTTGSIKEIKYINVPMVVVPLILISLSFIVKNNLLLSIILWTIAIIYILGFMYYIDTKRKAQNKVNESFKKEYKSLLNNVLAEIVDYSRLYKKSEEHFRELVEYLNNINIATTLMSDYRQIDLGGV